MRKAVLIDVLTVHGATGKAIIFTKTKRAADEIAAGVALTIPCEVSGYHTPIWRNSPFACCCSVHLKFLNLYYVYNDNNVPSPVISAERHIHLF